MILPRKPIRRLQKYRPPLEGRVGKLRLDFNENTIGLRAGGGARAAPLPEPRRPLLLS